MGVDTDSRLIVGWQIEISKFLDYLKENKMCDCNDGGKNPCIYAEDCWGEKWKQKHEFTIEFCSPYFDCRVSHTNVFVCITETHPTSSEMIDLLGKTELIKKAREFAVSMGAEDKELTISSEIHIW